MRLKAMTAGLAAATMTTLMTGAAVAQDGLKAIGKPAPAGINFQTPATTLAADIQWLDGMVNWIIGAIVLFVVLLLVIIGIRYNRRSNPNPASFTHNSPLEVAWTIGPIVILVFIGAFSLPVLFNQQEIPEGDLTIKAIGYQWYWGYEYPDEGLAFESYLLARDELAANGYAEDEYLLATDTAVVIPTGKTIVVQVTGADVIHAWTIPSFGVKQDAVPGRLAELWFEVEPGMEGIYFGQCSELCGKDHAFMPITVKAVTPADYEAWLGSVKTAASGAPQQFDVAAND